MIKIERMEDSGQPIFSLLEDMVVERGTKEDWERLHHLHYKAESLPPAPHFYRCRRESNNELVAVCVLSTVALLLAPRHDVLPQLKPGGDTTLTNKHRPRWLNDNMRRVGRIVTSTMYRGTGVSYRFMNLVCRMSGMRYLEIVSSMAKYNPFDKKAGFKRAPLRRASAYESGLKFLRSQFESHPADQMALLDEYSKQPEAVQKMIRKSCAEFYYKHSSKEKTGSNLGRTLQDVLEDMPMRELMRELNQLVFGYTVYALYSNPDHKRKLPDSIPLLAFDNQATNKPLEL
ncbi:hypothetical protein J4H70_18015 [Vibrio alginolyticus]|uniref:hypothetical protein n=2 Tax=Vibrio harveyi group TaxID=717610 RepID=UPI001BD426A1|nr:hypothetical protein [Vibrio alginolyticus]MBS9810672.1 hypothetical protein [Vibrio alginolyticus]MCQ9070928.1 hypothetical protein [Vibrio alginolyticus]